MTKSQAIVLLLKRAAHLEGRLEKRPDFNYDRDERDAIMLILEYVKQLERKIDDENYGNREGDPS